MHRQPVWHACAAAGVAEPEVLMVWPEAKTRKKKNKVTEQGKIWKYVVYVVHVRVTFTTRVVQVVRRRRAQAVGGWQVVLQRVA